MPEIEAKRSACLPAHQRLAVRAMLFVPGHQDSLEVVQQRPHRGHRLDSDHMGRGACVVIPDPGETGRPVSTSNGEWQMRGLIGCEAVRGDW